jgi:hypothetical protein
MTTGAQRQNKALCAFIFLFTLSLTEIIERYAGPDAPSL